MLLMALPLLLQSRTEVATAAAVTLDGSGGGLWDLRRRSVWWLTHRITDKSITLLRSKATPKASFSSATPLVLSRSAFDGD